MPVNSCPEAAPVFSGILLSLISIAAGQTLCCVFYCPQHSSSSISAPRLTHWGKGEREAINLPSCSCQQRVLPPSCWLSLSPPVFRISMEAAAHMNKNHCPCHLPWYGPPVLNENKYIKQLSLVGTGEAKESHVPFDDIHDIKLKYDLSHIFQKVGIILMARIGKTK